MTDASTSLVARPKDTLTRPRVRWGVRHFFYALLFMLGVQGVFTFIVSAVFVARQPSDVILAPDAADQLITQTLEFFITGPMLFASSLLMYLSWFAVAWYASWRKGYKSFARDFWLRYRWRRDILIALAITFILRGAEFLTSNALVWLGVDMRGTSNGAFLLEQPTIWFLANGILVACVLAPLFEEILFRGLLLQGLLRLGQKLRTRDKDSFLAAPLRFLGKHKNAFAVLVSSFFFGMMHFQGTEYFGHFFVIFWTGLVGLTMALIVLHTKRLGPAILTHILYNTSGVALMVLTVGLSGGTGV